MGNNIKFRAFIQTELGGFMIPDENSDCFMVSNGDGFIIYDENKNTINENRISLMQYTGLTDIYGKEIYEGDILKPTIKSGKTLGKIVWLENRSSFGIHWYLQLGTGDIEYCVNDLKMKVIGNFYQNPELLIKKLIK